MSKLVIPTGKDVMERIENTVVGHYFLFDAIYDERHKHIIKIRLFPKLQFKIEKLKYKYLQRKLGKNRIYKKHL